MEDKIALERHEHQIKSLIKRVDEMGAIEKTLHSMDKNYALQSQLLQSIVDHNKKQDIRMDKQDVRIDLQQEVMTQMSDNLTLLNTEIIEVKKEVKEVKVVQRESEKKNFIDTRDIWKDVLLKIVIPAGIGVVVLAKVVEFLVK